MAEGNTNADIAKQLWLTERTVETHVSSILGKLGLSHWTKAIAGCSPCSHTSAPKRGNARPTGARWTD